MTKPRRTLNPSTHKKPDRFWANLLCFWHLCGNAACRRAQACRGDFAACVRTVQPQLPQGVRDWLETMAAAQYAHVPFDEVMARLDENGLNRVLQEWRAAALAGAETRDGAGAI